MPTSNDRVTFAATFDLLFKTALTFTITFDAMYGFHISHVHSL